MAVPPRVEAQVAKVECVARPGEVPDRLAVAMRLKSIKGECRAIRETTMTSAMI
jgi:hypothetical protein